MDSTQESLRTHIGPLQRSRWVYVINNYDRQFNFRNHLSKSEFKIKRAVWGHEVGAEGTPHIQGYMEIDRSVRLCHVKRIFPNAYWDSARKGPLENFEYCTKQGNYDCLGDFSNIYSSTRGGNSKPPSVSLILKGLLDRKKRPQVKVSKEYADRHLYFERMQMSLMNLNKSVLMFNKWKDAKIYPWQQTAINMIMNQSEREILWIVDFIGNEGKSFLANILNILYNFSLFNGKMSVHDIGPMLTNVQGFVFDVPRSKLESFDYGTIECVKNGFIASGKYHGVFKRFEPVPVVVFANGNPDQTQLSVDRWNIVELGKGEFSDMRKDIKFDLPPRYPLYEPPNFPNLQEDFDLRRYLEEDSETVVGNPQPRFQAPAAVGLPTTSGLPNPILNVTISSSQELSQAERRIVLPAPPICERHPNQGRFRKGCPCLSKKSRRVTRQLPNDDGSTDVRSQRNSPTAQLRSVRTVSRRERPSPGTAWIRTASIAKFAASLE